MKNRMYKTELNIIEFINLFKRKRCKLCGTKLTKLKHYNNIGYNIDRIMNVKFKGEIVNVHFEYKCEKCNKEYDLKDL